MQPGAEDHGRLLPRAGARLAKPKAYRWRSGSLEALFTSRSCLFILAVNWLLQGVRGMDAKELSFRLMLLGMLTAGLAVLLTGLLAVPPLVALGLGMLGGHTVNFLLNGQFWVCLRYCPAYRLDPSRLARALDRLLDGLATRPWLEEAVLIGSTVRPGSPLGARSDIDLRLVFPPGIRGWLRTNLLLLRLRGWALVSRLPLDVYAYEHPATLRRFDQSEPLGIILDRRARLRRGFANRQLVWLRP